MTVFAKSSLILAALAAIGAGTSLHAQKQIHFATGKTSAVVKGTTGEHGVYYLIRAKSGQKLVLDLTTTEKLGVKVEIDGTYGEMVLLREPTGGHYEIGLEESGEYMIFVGSNSASPIRFILTVSISKLADI